jgi:hypothetical protein
MAVTGSDGVSLFDRIGPARVIRLKWEGVSDPVRENQLGEAPLAGAHRAPVYTRPSKEKAPHRPHGAKFERAQQTPNSFSAAAEPRHDNVFTSGVAGMTQSFRTAGCKFQIVQKHWGIVLGKGGEDNDAMAARHT